MTRKGVDPGNKKLVAMATSVEGSIKITSVPSYTVKVHRTCKFHEDRSVDVDIFGLIEITKIFFKHERRNI